MDKDKRDAILNGIRGASELHEQFGFLKTLKDGKEGIDVFQVISNLNIPLLCRPLDGLLGLYNSTPLGILVTTNRRLPIQRFTAAHELGHHVLAHKESYDSGKSIKLARQSIKEIYGGDNSNQIDKQSIMQCPFQEIEAEAFASEFLLPKWLLIAMIKRQGLGKSDLKKPEIVYQLSLRAGVSYEAMLVCLLSNNMISRSTMISVKKITPKKSKLDFLEKIKSLDPWADVHLLTEKDNGLKIFASPEDTVIIELCEHLSGGYIWSKPETANGLELIEDERSDLQSNYIGGEPFRKITIRGKKLIDLKLKESRQWEEDTQPINNFEVTLDFSGKEIGLPRVTRQ